MEETVICFGGEVKALEDGRVEGYLVRFSSAQDPDISSARDFFTKSTDYDLERSTKATVYFDHGLDSVLKRRKIGLGEMKVDDIGVWISAQLDRRDKYEKAIYDMAKSGKLGWSSGTASHLVERKSVGGAHEIVRWPLGLDASLTPSPAEPRNDAIVPLKSYEASRPEVKFVLPEDVADAPEAKPGAITIKGIFNDMLTEQAQESMNPYRFLDAFQRAFDKICEAGEVASLLPTTVNFNGLIDEAVSEFAARLRQWAYDEFQKDMEGESEMMPSYLSIRTPLKTLVSLKSNPHAGMRFQQHSETLLAAVDEFTDEGRTLVPVLKAWGERNASIVTERNIKEGRAISSASKGRMEAACMKIQSAKAEMQGVHDALQELIALAAPKQDAVKSDEPPAPEPDPAVDDSTKSTQDAIAQEFARFIQLTAGIAA